MPSLKGLKPRNRDERRLLNKINKIRTILKLKPLSRILKGNTEDPTSCPIANSISHGFKNYVEVEVDDQSIFVDTDPHDINNYFYSEETPQYVRNWIDKFDKGEIPQLIDK